MYTLYPNFHSDRKQIQGEACLMRCQHDVKCNIFCYLVFGELQEPTRHFRCLSFVEIRQQYVHD